MADFNTIDVCADGDQPVTTVQVVVSGVTSETQTFVLQDADTPENVARVTDENAVGVQEVRFDTLTPPQVSIPGSTSSQLFAAGVDRLEIIVKNGSLDDTMYIGPVGVTSGFGFPLEPLDTFSINRYDGELYGISSGVTITAYVLIQNNPVSF